MRASRELTVLLLALARLQRLVLGHHLGYFFDLGLVEDVLIAGDSLIGTVDQTCAVVDLVALLHEDCEIVRLALLGALLALEVLVADVGPVAQPALHDALDEPDLLRSCPVRRQKREVEVIVDIVRVRCLVERIVLARLAHAQALQAHDHLSFWRLWIALRRHRRAVRVNNLYRFRDIALAEHADLRTEQVLRLLESLNQRLVNNRRSPVRLLLSLATLSGPLGGRAFPGHLGLQLVYRRLP